MNTDKIEKLLELCPDAMIMDGFDDCIVGVVEKFGKPDITCYSKEKIVQKLMKSDMDREEALEFFYFNQIGAYLGKNTPCFIEYL